MRNNVRPVYFFEDITKSTPEINGGTNRKASTRIIVRKLNGTFSAYKIPKIKPAAESKMPPIRGFFDAKIIRKMIGAA